MVSSQFRLRTIRFLASGVALGILTTLAGAANAQSPSWKFEKGKTLRYSYTEKTASQSEVQGQAFETTVSQTLELVWKIDSIDDGKAKITQTVDGITFAMDSPFAKLDYDTKARDKAPEDAFGSGFSKIMNVLADSKTTFTMDAHGAISDVSTDEMTVKGLKAAVAMPGAAPPNADGLKVVILQTTLVLPAKTLAKGTTWKSSVRLPDPPFGEKTLDSTFTAQGQDESAGPKVLKITVESAAKYSPKEGAGFSKKVKEQSINGAILFDTPEGNLLSSKLVEKSAEVMTVQGNDIDQKVEKTRTIVRRK